MSADLQSCLTEREALIARLREAYGFSVVEAQDFIDRFGVDIVVDDARIPVELAA